MTRWRARARASLIEYLPSESQYVFGLTLVIGAVCGLIAVGFHLSIRFAERQFIDRAMHSEGWSSTIWIVLTPTLGGLVAGAALMYVVPGARGSGIPQVKEAFVLKNGFLSLKDAVGKFIVTVIQIGSGASLGREGPTVHICAAASSVMGRMTSLPSSSRRRLMPVGVAAGIAAAFNAPIAAVTFTIEEVVGTLDQTVLSGVVVAAAVAAVIERSVLGVNPVIAVSQVYGLDHVSSLPMFALLGLAAAFVSITFTDLLLKLRVGFRTLTRVPRWAHPAVGGFVTGALALFMFRVAGMGGINGGGYAVLGQALGGRITVEVLAALCALKLIATVCSFSSGGSGGIFAPSLFIGAMLGGIVGYIDSAALGHESRELGAFALVGMGATFAGIIRAPITSVLIIFEMTGSYGLVLPLMMANMISYGLARHLRPTPIYEAILEQDGIHLPDQQALGASLERLPVERAMSGDVLSLQSDTLVTVAAEQVKGKTFSVCPVLDAERRFAGIVALDALRSAAVADPSRRVGDLCVTGETVSVETPLNVAATRMHAEKVRRLVVLDVTGRLAGILTMSDVVRAHARAAHASTVTQSDALLATKVSLLVVEAAPVTRAMPLRELLERLLVAKAAALPVEADSHGCGIVLLDDVRELWSEGNELDSVLVAADVARNAPALTPDADVLQALKLMDQEKIDALPIIDGPPGSQPSGVLTRADVGRFLFAQYARRGRSHAG